ncbi:hypothetical protein [Kordia jejudonensis]|uniref:hypothetical protein n=1 Tax=Kordia jejudonensis TaxID=1348245 RepID=UPI0006297AD8|nr:hypothetical protein [Kordia jejudonensis]
MKKKNLKNLVLRKQSVSNLNHVSGGTDVAQTVVDIITTLTKITREFSYCPHVSCGCPDPTIPALTEGILTCRRTACDELTCVTCA